MDDKDKSKEAKKRKIIDGKSVRIEKVFVGEQMGEIFFHNSFSSLFKPI